MNGAHWKSYVDAKRNRAEAVEWLSHIGKRGRETDVLSLSPIHAQLNLVIAGQYSAGGTNYRDSPKSFNTALLEVIHQNFPDLSMQAMDLLEDAEREALIKAKAEVEAVVQEIAAAEAAA